MKNLKNVTVNKLREYSQSYGSVVVLEFPLAQTDGKFLYLFDEYGNLYRKMRIGTKLLVSFTGTEITERSFKIAQNKLLKALELSKIQQKIENQKFEEARENMYNLCIELTETKFFDNLEAIKIKVSEKYPNLNFSHQTSKQIAFFINTKFMNNTANTVHLARLIRENIKTN